MGLLTWFVAVSLIDLSLATALSKTLPIFITILAPLILGEKVGARRFIAVVIGFIGVALLLEPVSFEKLGLGLVAGLAAPFFAALMFIFLRRLGPTEAAVSNGALVQYDRCCAGRDDQFYRRLAAGVHCRADR